MGAKRILAILALALSLGALATPALAAESMCGKVACAASPSQCGSKFVTESSTAGSGIAEPTNCLFLDEPIGGKPGFDLYLNTCLTGGDGKSVCSYDLWNGGQIPKDARGPLQAVLTSQAGKEYQGPFGLLYNYLSLIYNYMSGLIIGVAVLFVVVGGIQIATSGGESEGVSKGKKRIIQAITGVILWFTASLILYTINPTFFAF